MPVTINGTTGVVFPDGVTQGSGVPTASGTSGAPLVSNGTIYTQNTAVAVAFGGTGATDAGTARSNLGTNDAANITTGTLSSSRLPTTGVNAASITTGTLAVANGGTGTATPSLVAGTNITISGAWPNQTVTAAGGGVTSLNGQTGAITTTSFDVIGSVAWLGNATTSNLTAGTTTAGSNLRYATAVTYTETSNWWCEGNPNAGKPWTSALATNFFRFHNVNTGYVVPPNTTTVSGTWRALTTVSQRAYDWDGSDSRAGTFMGLFVRVS